MSAGGDKDFAGHQEEEKLLLETEKVLYCGQISCNIFAWDSLEGNWCIMKGCGFWKKGFKTIHY